MPAEEKINEDNLKALHSIDANLRISQRGAAQEMKFNLGKANYCIKALMQFGLIKLKNFSQSNNKTPYLYVLSPKSAKEKKVLTSDSLKKKQLEHEKLYHCFN